MRMASFKAQSRCFGQSRKSVVWLQGCRHRCPGCIAPEWQATDRGQEISVPDMAAQILKNPVEGVVISGGEPLLQYHCLIQLLALLRVRQLGIILYTGFEMDRILASFSDVLFFSDIVIAGPYIETLNDGKGLRGSSNQKIYFLTNRYIQEKYLFEAGNRILEIDIHQGSLSFCGIPPKDAAKFVQQGMVI